MIQLNCTNCDALLTMDDAFAGAVCRCQHCGTIQTVPAEVAGTESGRPPVAQVVKGPKALYQGPVPGSGSALDELAQAVASSGLSGTGLRSGRLRRPAAGAGTRIPFPIIAVAVGAAVILVLVIALILRDRTAPAPPKPDTPTDLKADGPKPAGPAASDRPGTPESPTDVQTPNFMGAPLKGPSVIYLLDRGQGTAETFDAIKGGAAKSLLSLGKDIKFQVIFWETDTLVAFPPGSLKYATPENVEAARKVMADVYFYGQSHIDQPLEKALAQNPAEIVIATGKSELDDEFVRKVLDLRKDRPVKIHTFSLGRLGSPGPLKSIAEKTGGEFRQITGQLLQDFAEFTPG
jgi:hypothetical protein